MTTTDRTCPSWCTGCDVDHVDGSLFHYSAPMSLPGDDENVGPNGTDAQVFAMYGVGKSTSNGLRFRVTMDHFLTPAQMRQAAAALLNIAEAHE